MSTNALNFNINELIEKAIKDKQTELSIEKKNFEDNESKIFQKIADIRGLKKLTIRKCELQSIPQNIILLQGLEELSLSSNIITNVPDCISELRNLKILELFGNRITKISDNLFELKKLTHLDIRGNEIQELPTKIRGLVNLNWLGISKNFLHALPVEISELSKLESLRASHNLLVSLPSEIRKLSNLRSLKLNDNKFIEFPIELTQLQNLELLEIGNEELLQSDTRRFTSNPLTGKMRHSVLGNSFNYIPEEICVLVNLKELIIEGAGINELPPTLGQLKNLQTLNFYSNNISELPDEITEIENLEYLNLSFNPIQYLPKEIGRLKKLKYLHLSNTQIRFLPSQAKELTRLEALDVTESLMSIPPEISGKVDVPSVILNYFFQHLPGDIGQSIESNNSVKEFIFQKHLDEAKLLILGQGSVGKTSILNRLTFDKFDLDEKKTDGIVIYHIKMVAKDKKSKFEEYTVALNVWDFGGQEIMHATHQFFLTKRSLYLLVLDSRLTQEENRVEYWLKIIQSFGGESPVLIVGNKIDQHPLDIDRTGLQKKYSNIVGVLKTSAATGAGIETLRTAITEQVNNLPHVRDLLPETWFRVKTKLEWLGRKSNFITYGKYLELCVENEITDETSQRTLIGFLHDLGVVLHFQDDRRLAELGILNPQWVTNGVYKILNDKALFANKGVLTLPLLDQILSMSEYPQNKRLFIVDMMKKFELCYDIDRDNFLIPDLLPKDEPELKFNGIPAFEYAYPVLPSSVITRFIVRMNQKIDGGLVWRTGVVLKIGENTALVKADIEDRKITIAIEGVEHTRRDALSAIRFQLDEIHGSIKGLDAQKRVPIPEAPNADPLDYDYLLQLERDGELEILPVKDGSRLVKVNVRKLLSGVVSETERKLSAGNTTNIYIGGDVKGGTIIAGDENEVKK